MDATKVCISTKFPQREARSADQSYLCYEETTPPWDKDFFFIKDEAGRNWFCHASAIELNNHILQKFAEQIKEDYTPKNKKVLEKRLHSPLIIQIVLCRAASQDELKALLGTVQLQREKT
jgi:hypothetical protein